MSTFYDQLSEVLRRYLSDVNAHAILRQVVTECRKTQLTLSRADIPVVAPRLDRAIALFLDPQKRSALRAEIEGLGGGASQTSIKPAPRPQIIAIRAENDISDARLAARQMCVELNARPLQTQKVAIAVSELARNIISYTPGGRIELTPRAEKPSSVTILSADEGGGIPNLSEILSGQYRSKTGLGMGILGTKRLADRFDIQSTERGTRIQVTILV
jgi:serine/threonine-protein kinase RsbT